MTKGSPDCPYDLCFDLDEALTMPESSIAVRLTEPQAASALALPTVFAAGVCTVCLEAFDAEKGAKSMPCGHLYHDTCISTWLSGERSCPICRCPFKADK